MSILQENARAVFIEQAQAPSPSPSPVTTGRNTGRSGRGARLWTSWIFAAPALAMLAVGVFAGYEAGEKKFAEPQSIDQYAVHGLARGIENETVVMPRPGSQFFTLYMDRGWERDYPSYRAEVRDAANNVERASLPVPAPSRGGTISFLFRAHEFAPGRYVLSIFGKDSAGQETKVGDYSFTLRFE